MEGVYLQWGAVAFLGVGQLLLIGALVTLARGLGRIETGIWTLVELHAADKGVRVANPPPAAQKQSVTESISRMAMGGDGH